MSSTCPHNMVNFGVLAAEIGLRVCGPLQISIGFASWQRYCTASSSGHQPNFAAFNRERHLCSAGRPSGWALAHILVHSNLVLVNTNLDVWKNYTDILRSPEVSIDVKPWFHVKIIFLKNSTSEPPPSVAHPIFYFSAWFHHKMKQKSFMA